LSRIDTLVDPRLEALAKRGGGQAELAQDLYGEVALASAKLAYRFYRRLVESERWAALARHGARPQWLLWGSTGTKNPRFDELKYVEPLIGAETISTLPPQTLAAYRSRGKPAARLGQGVDRAEAVMERLAAIGIDIDEVTQALETEGIQKFEKSFGDLLHDLGQISAAGAA
jgi:transaldolase/glucose-6-phosphate isomerase